MINMEQLIIIYQALKMATSHGVSFISYEQNKFLCNVQIILFPRKLRDPNLALHMFENRAIFIDDQGKMF